MIMYEFYAFCIIGLLMLALKTFIALCLKQNRDVFIMLIPVYPITIEKDKPKSISEILEEYIKDIDYEMIESKNLFETFKKCTEVINKNLKRIHGPEFKIVLSQNDVKASADEYLKKVSLSRVQCNSTKDILQRYTLYITDIDRDSIEALCIEIKSNNRRNIIKSYMRLYIEDFVNPFTTKSYKITSGIFDYNNYARLNQFLLQTLRSPNLKIIVYINLLHLIPNDMGMTMMQQIQHCTSKLDESETINNFYKLAKSYNLLKNRIGLVYDENADEESKEQFVNELIMSTGLTQHERARYLRHLVAQLYAEIKKAFYHIFKTSFTWNEERIEFDQKTFRASLVKYNERINAAISAITKYIKNNTKNIDIYNFDGTNTITTDKTITSIIDAIECKINIQTKTKDDLDIVKDRSKHTNGKYGINDSHDATGKHINGTAKSVKPNAIPNKSVKEFAADDDVTSLLPKSYICLLNSSINRCVF